MWLLLLPFVCMPVRWRRRSTECCGIHDTVALGILYALALGVSGYATVPRPSGSSFMSLRHSPQAPGQQAWWVGSA
jgi:hypothetical protein